MSHPMRDHRDDDGSPRVSPSLIQSNSPQLITADDFTYNLLVCLGLRKNYRYLHVNKE